MNQRLSFEDELTALLPRLRGFAHALSRDTSDADDLTQMTVERALRSKSQWQPGTRLDSWTHRIMRNAWIDLVRSRGRRGRFEGPQAEAERVGHDPRNEIEASIELKQIMEALEALPDEQREVLALVVVEGFSYRETAAMLGLPIGTVSSRVARARFALMAMVGEA